MTEPRDRIDGQAESPTRLLPFNDLVGRQEIAELLSVSVSSVDTWRHRHASFPDPLAILSGTPIWRWSEIQMWHRTYPRKPGRPRKSSGSS